MHLTHGTKDTTASQTGNDHALTALARHKGVHIGHLFTRNHCTQALSYIYRPPPPFKSNTKWKQHLPLL